MRIMSVEEMKLILKKTGKEVNSYLGEYIRRFPHTPERLASSMLYSLEAGGKRLRPVLCLTCAGLLGVDASSVMPFACAIEMIHTYSLIHDDLPAMDNDDLRRGKPSNHKAFDEATAILAGDALLTDAFTLMTRTRLEPERVLMAIREFAMAAGSSGMAGGQMLDMEYTAQKGIELEQIRKMQGMKTGAIIRASCVCAAILSGCDAIVKAQIAEYGKYLGIAYQIADDILDLTATTEELGKPAGSDIEQGKNTYPALIGIENSRQEAIRARDRALEALNGFDNPEAAFLRSLACYAVARGA